MAGRITATYTGTGTFNVHDPGQNKAMQFVSGGTVDRTISDELAMILSEHHSSLFTLTSATSVFSAEDITAASNKNSTAVSGKAWCRAEVHAAITVAGSTGSFTVKMQVSYDGTTYVDVPCYDASSGAFDAVTSKALTSSDSIILVLDTWAPYVRINAANTRDATCAITADIHLR